MKGLIQQYSCVKVIRLINYDNGEKYYNNGEILFYIINRLEYLLLLGK